MHYPLQSFMRVASPAVALSLFLGACGSVEGITEKFRSAPSITNIDWMPYSRASMASAPELSRAPATPADFINPDGSCAGANPDNANGPTAAGIALQMTECAVVSILGMPEHIDISANERGERTATVLYSRGERPGRYYFTAGQLTLIERVAEPAPPPKPQKPAAKPRRAVG